MSKGKMMVAGVILVIGSIATLVAQLPSWGRMIEFNKGEVYYTDSVSLADAEAVGKYLVDIELFDGQSKTVQIDRQNGVYQFRVVILPEFMNDREVEAGFRVIGQEMRNTIFKGQPFEVHMTNNMLKTQKILTIVKSQGEVLKFQTSDLYYTSQVTKAEAEKFGKYLVETGFFNEIPKTVQLDKNEDAYKFRFVLKEEVDPATVSEIDLIRFAEWISKEVFENTPVDVHLTDVSLHTLRIVKMPRADDPVELTNSQAE